MESIRRHDRPGDEGQPSRRRFLLLTGTVATAVVAGCSESGSSDGDADENDDGEGNDASDGDAAGDGAEGGDGDAGDGQEAGEPGDSDGSMGSATATGTPDRGTIVDRDSVGESAVDSLSIASHTRNDTRPEAGGQFRVEVTVENAGSETSGELTDYGWHLQVYDRYGTALVDEGETDPRLQTSTLDTSIDPGGSRTVFLTPTSASGFSRAAEDADIGWYEFELRCPSEGSPQPYCG